MSARQVRRPRKWTPEEDRRLQERVERCRQGGHLLHWGEISDVFEDRTNNDCRKRWAKLDCRWRKGPWDAREKELLRKGIAEHGQARSLFGVQRGSLWSTT